MTQKALPVFTHIPKTAGSTLNRLLTEQYFFKPGRAFAGGGQPFFELFVALSEKDKRNLKIVKEHFHFGVHKYCPFPVRYFTMLRQPHQRAISQYNYVRRLGRYDPRYKQYHPENHTLVDFLEKGIVDELDNGQVRYLCGIEDIPYGQVTEHHLQLALHNLETYYLVGLTERFAESVLLFAKDLGWSTPFFVEGNVSPIRAHEVHINDQERALLDHYNRYDQVLYDKATQIFARQIGQAGQAFGQEVADFLVRNNKRRLLTTLNVHILSKFRYFNKHHLRNMFQILYEHLRHIRKAEDS